MFLGACRRRRRREGLKMRTAPKELNFRGGLGMRAAPKALNFRAKRGEFNSALTLRRRAKARRRCVPRRVSASAKARRLEALSTPGGLGRTGQLSGIWLGLWESASGDAAQSASMFIWHRHISQRTYNTAVFIPHSFSSSSARSSAVLLICFICLCLFQLVSNLQQI